MWLPAQKAFIRNSFIQCIHPRWIKVQDLFCSRFYEPSRQRAVSYTCVAVRCFVMSVCVQYSSNKPPHTKYDKEPQLAKAFLTSMEESGLTNLPATFAPAVALSP